jgi:hypothetical protein
MDNAVERAGVPSHAIVIVVAPSSRMQTLEACPPRQGPVWLAPGREPLARGVELLARGAPHDAWHAVPLWPPEERESQQGEAPLLARVQTTEPSQMGLLRCHLEVALLQPFGQPLAKPFRVLLQAEGTPPVLSLSAQQCFSPTVWLHHCLQPEGQGVVQRPMCEDRTPRVWGAGTWEQYALQRVRAGQG